MPDFSYLIPLQLISRFVLDFFSIGTKNDSYYFDFCYFLLFLAAGIAIFSGKDLHFWGVISLGISAYSFIQFYIKRKKNIASLQSKMKSSSEK